MYRAVYIGVRTHTRLAVCFLSPLSPVLKGNITRIQVVVILNRPFDTRLLDNMLWRVFLLLFGKSSMLRYLKTAAIKLSDSCKTVGGEKVVSQRKVKEGWDGIGGLGGWWRRPEARTDFYF